MMMNSMHHGFFFFGTFHLLGMLAFLLGIILLVIWAVKHLTPHQLYIWGWTLLGSGVALCLIAFLTLSFSGSSMRTMKADDRYMERGGMKMMERADDDKGMTMNGMVKALDGKTGDDFDRAFLEMMIEHHQGAIDMANAALDAAGHDEVKDMSNDILSAQQTEIDKMKEWQESWGFNQ